MKEKKALTNGPNYKLGQPFSPFTAREKEQNGVFYQAEENNNKKRKEIY